MNRIGTLSMNLGSRVFPTGVGMNRVSGVDESGIDSVPHRRGDEPIFDCR